MKITETELIDMFNRFERAARRAGFQTTDPTLVLHLGQPSVGQAFRMFLRDSESGGLSTLPMTNDEGWIGNTRREAYEALLHMARTLEALTGEGGK